GMIRCAFAEILRPVVSTLRRRSSASSSVSTFGSITTPFPITQRLPGCRSPDGIRCSLQVFPLRTKVRPALVPPSNAHTASPRCASRSVIFPLPSSPHWAPTTTIPGIRNPVYVGRGRRYGGAMADKHETCTLQREQREREQREAELARSAKDEHETAQHSR